MKVLAGVLCLVCISAFVEGKISQLEYGENENDWQLSSSEELQGEDRIFGTILSVTKNAAGTATKMGVKAATLTKDAAVKSATLAKDVTVKSATLAKDTTVKAAVAAKDASVAVAKAGVNLVQYVSESSATVAMDALLFNMKLLLKASGKENIVLPEIEKTFAGVSFETSEGYFRTLKNLTRSGKVKMSMSGMSLIITFPLSISGLEVGYHNYTAKAWIASSKGDFQVSIDKNTIEMSLRITPGLTCQMNVDKVQVTELEGIKIKFNGLCGACAKIVEMASTSLANYLQETIKAKVQSSIDEAIRNALESNPIMCANLIGSEN